MARFNRIKKDIIGAMKETSKEKTKAYDTQATVTRIEGNTAWVHIPGGTDETPVQLTIDAKAGDTVRVRVGGGQAWLTGNGSAPPTDDTVAKEAKVTATDAGVLAGIAKQTADQAGKTATNYLSWSSEYGLVVSEDATEDVTAMTGGNTRITSDGMEIYAGQDKVASFGVTAVIGDENTTHVEINNNSFQAARGSSSPYLFMGYGDGGSYPHFSLGRWQGSSATYGNYSVSIGTSIAGGDDSIACGVNNRVSGSGSAAFGSSLTASGNYQTVIGVMNVEDTSNEYAFIIGNGSEEDSNALTVDWYGNLTCGSMDSGKVSSISVSSQSSTSGSVNFSKTFSDVPVVVASFSSNTTGSPVYDFGNCSVSVYNVSTTGFDYRVFNAGSANRSPSFSWIAMLT